MLNRLNTFLSSNTTPQWITADVVDPGVKTNWSFFPFMQALKDGVGGVIAIALVLSVLAFVGSLVMLALSKSMKAQGMSTISTTALLWSLVCAVGVASGSGAVAWAAGIDIGF